MATKVKPCRIKATGTPQVGYVPKYVDEDTFQWGAGGGGGGSDIVYATQAEYNALLPGAASDGKHYFIYSTDGGGGWQPGADTILYLPLTSDVNDASLTPKTPTVTSSPTFITDGTVQCASFNSNYFKYTLNEGNTQLFTISVWLKKNGYQRTRQEATAIGALNMSTRNVNLGISSGKWWFTGGSGDVISTVTVDSNRNHLVLVGTTTGITLYINGVQSITDNIPYDSKTITYADFGKRGSFADNGDYYGGYMSKFILENKVWSAQEISDYYDLTKGDYGIS